MLNQSNITPQAGSKKTSKRLGRGNGSGKGTYSGRGVKGQWSRTGRGKFNPAFEWGQTPLFRRLPKKRGFTAYKPAEFAIVNVSDLSQLWNEGVKVVDLTLLKERGIIRRNRLELLKVLANGDISVSITVKTNKISKEAREKIEKAGGTIELI